MSSQARNSRGDERRIEIRTLVIASIASAVAAIVVSRVWTAGTPIAAAATPVLVTLFREALDRPTSKIAERLTSDSPAVADTTIREPDRPRSQAKEVGSPEQTKPGDVRIYRQGSSATERTLGKISPKVVLVTGLLAFVIAGVVVTAGQIAVGNPFGSDGKGAIILGQDKRKSKKNEEENQGKTVTETVPAQTAPQSTTTTPSEDQQQSTTTTPQTTTPQETAPQAAPRTQTQTTPAPTP